jgi:hypothetical protein
MDFNAFFYYSGLLILFYAATILIHEVGHYLAYLNFKGKNKLTIRYGKANTLFFPITFALDIDDVDKQHHLFIIVMGIFSGFIFLLVFAFVFEFYYLGLLYFPYWFGIQHDLRQIRRLNQ